MCALATLLPCPICAHQHFESVDSLRDKLIYVSTHILTCPVCQEEVSGLDKLTIHLFGHVKNKDNSPKTVTKSSELPREKNDSKTIIEKPQACKRPRTQPTKNKTVASAKAPVKFVKIYPKLPVISLNTVPIVKISHNSIGETLNNSLCLSAITNVGSQVVSRIEPTNSNCWQIACETCGLHFRDEQVLNMHKSLIHGLNEGTAPQNSESFQCHLCSKSFKMKGSLMVHLRVVHYGIASNRNIKNFASTSTGPDKLSEGEPVEELPSSGNVHVAERNDNKQWFCDVCEKSFTTKYFLRKHKRLHTGETPYACIQCNKTFTFQQSYHKHLLYHNDEKPHTCTYCGRSFKELSTLHNHQRIHTGEKPFSCETCGKCFRQRVSYLVHRRIHTGVMPYKCTACDKSFRYKVSQRTHKCPAQPPGTVVRQSGELLEKLKKKNILGDSVSQHVENNHQDKHFPEMLGANDDVIRYGAKLSFEDTEADNFSMILKSPMPLENDNLPQETYMEGGECISSITKKQNNDGTANPIYVNVGDVSDLTDHTNNVDKNIPSPSDILKKLCLSNYEDDYFANGESQSGTHSHEELNLDVFYKDFNDFL